MSDNCRPCDDLNCIPPDDLRQYSLDGLPPIPPSPPVPEPPLPFGNSGGESYICDCSGPAPPPDECPTITITPGSLPELNPGVPYSETLLPSGGTYPYTFAITNGELPTGLTLSADGVIEGTPTVLESQTFTVTVTDLDGCTGYIVYTITVACPTITLSPGTLPAGEVGVAYSETISASGGIGPYTFAVISGALPDGLSLTANRHDLTLGRLGFASR